MGLEASDIDIATPALPEDVMKCCQAAGLSVHPTGLAHGTVTVVSDHVPYEVTTLRRDVETDGRRATIAYTEDWAEDAARRDFTINAIYCDRHGEIHDPLGGLPDLRNLNVRFIGSARERIREDYLRILRFFRFFASYGRGPIDAEGLEACVEEREGLRGLSAERVRSELLKLLVAPRAYDALEKIQGVGLDGLITDRRADLQRFRRYTELESAVGATANSINRLGALFADNVEEARRLAAKLRLSNIERRQLVLVAEPSKDADFTDERSRRVALYKLGVADYRSVCLMVWTRSAANLPDPEFRSAYVLPDQWQPGKMPFKGADVISLGATEGLLIGNILKEFEDWWIASDFPVDRDLLKAKLIDLVAATPKGKKA